MTAKPTAYMTPIIVTVFYFFIIFKAFYFWLWRRRALLVEISVLWPEYPPCIPVWHGSVFILCLVTCFVYWTKVPVTVMSSCGFSYKCICLLIYTFLFSLHCIELTHCLSAMSYVGPGHGKTVSALSELLSNLSRQDLMTVSDLRSQTFWRDVCETNQNWRP